MVFNYEIYENGGHAYHTTMPTDSLTHFRDTMLETQEYGFDKLYKNQWELGNRVRDLLKSKNIKSVAADGLELQVVVSYTSDENIHNGLKFKELGMQIAAGVPLGVTNLKVFKLLE